MFRSVFRLKVQGLGFRGFSPLGRDNRHKVSGLCIFRQRVSNSAKAYAALMIGTTLYIPQP